MPKDDYIRFRCSTNLKELAGKQAEEKGMNITDYMEYLIRKDGKNMMYVYCAEEENKELVNKIVNNGIAIRIHPDDNMYLLSKVDKIVIGENMLEYSYSLEEYITMCDGGEYVTLIDGIQIGMDDSIETLLGELYEPCNDDGVTYAERIYNSDDPYNEIKKMINEFLLIRIDFVMTDIKCRVTQIQKDIENGTLEWE